MKNTWIALHRLPVFGGLILLALLLAAFGPGPASAATAASAAEADAAVPFFTPDSCMFSMPEGWVEGVNVDCGYLTVPEQYASPDGPTIELAVAIVRSQDPQKLPDPLVMLQGGPGGSTIDTYTQILPGAGRLPANRDVVLFDQRGTLYSRPALVCDEFIDLTIATIDQDLSSEESNRLSLETLQKCRDRLTADGVNLSAYDSLENAADVESLRVALGYEQINLYGVSYGTLLALHVMREHPQGLRSVIIDSVVPTQTNFVLGAPQTENRAFEKLFSACASDPDCNAAYPDLRQVFYDLADRLNADPVDMRLTDMETGITYDSYVDGDTLISIVFQMMYNTEFIPFLPRVIYDARAGEWGVIERILSIVAFDRTMSYGMYYSVVCAEDADFQPADFDLSGLPKQLVELEKDSAQYMLDACRLWNVEALDPSVDAPVQSELPTLVLTGEFDPITPPDYAREAATSLPNSFLFVFPAGGHGEVASTACADSILLQFLDDPSSAPDAACIAAGGEPKFAVGKTLVRLPALIQLLNLQGGTGWQLALYLPGLVFMLSALAVYPGVWLVRLFRKPQPAAQPVARDAYGQPYAGVDPYGRPYPAVADAPQKPRPLLYRLAPWAAGLLVLLLLVFTGVLVALMINLALANDTIILLGLPGSARLLFLLPPLVLLLALVMFFGAAAAWMGGAGSVWGRLYLSMLSFTALTCTAVLAQWGMLFALFGG